MSDSTLVDDARKRLLDMVPHLLVATEMARLQVPDGKVGLAVIATSADGSGRVTARFEGEFAKDLAIVLGFDPLADDNDNEESTT